VSGAVVSYPALTRRIAARLDTLVANGATDLETIKLAILKITNGNPDGVDAYVELAREHWRELVYWAFHHDSKNPQETR
jgi:hypothetical protein